ncbi:MAG TPA: PQQ-binding-like beta-propeller repeat protein [Terriglobales bacterium]|nr:PQQ-binding-like beta-propeller repeat protein [Terriglobales bacterium]
MSFHAIGSTRRKYTAAISVTSCILALLVTVDCGGGGSGGSTSNPTSPSSIKIGPISPSNATLNPGGTQQFKTSVTGTTNTSVDWEVNGKVGGAPATGTISAAGLYTAPMNVTQPTTFTITAMSAAENSVTATASVAVNPTAIVSVAVSPTSANVAVAGTQAFTASVSGSSNTSVTWSVDGINGGNTTTGTVSSTGLYTAPAVAGPHTVTATSAADTTKKASASVSVVSLAIAPSGANVAPNGTQQFTATVLGTNNTAVTWSVDGILNGNSTVGTISSTGLYTAPGTAGDHTITATSVLIPTLSANATVSVQNSSQGTVSVLTYHNDDVRDGANTNETTLTLSNVNSQQFGKKYVFPVDGQVYTQPLYVPNLSINGASHNTVFVATENDTVYAFDADGLSQTALWQNHLGTAVQNNDPYGIQPLLGITATPVIDPATNTLYVIAVVEQNGGRVFQLHALDITTGAEKLGGPVVVTGTVPGTGTDSVNGEITLETNCYPRTGLALDPISNGIYIGFGHCSHGWMVGYDKTTLQQTGIMNATPNGAGGGFWNGGGAPAVDDSSGDLFFISGVDEDDPMSGYNDSAIRFSASNLSVLDYFMPSNENYLSMNDLDVGSGAGIIMPDNGSSTPHEYIGGGKDGRIFVINRDNMGQFQNVDQVIQEVQTGVNQHDNIWSTPTLWNSMLYYHCQDDVLRAFSWDVNTGLLSTSPISIGSVTYGVHGATSTISSNGATNGIVWEIETTNQPTGGVAILHAYNATLVDQELYNTNQAAGGRDTAGPAVKFAVPTVADGHVFVGTASELDIYGLLSQP